MKNIKRIGPKESFKDWNFPIEKREEQVIENMMRRAASFAFDEMMSTASGAGFPACWKGHAEKGKCDPLDIELNFNEKSPVYRISIKAAIDSYLDDCRRDGSFSEGLSLISVEFRKLADKIDRAIAKGESENRAYEKRAGKSASVAYEPDA